jgi:pimeloyl-ACP methyl ester carboxylesterase
MRVSLVACAALAFATIARTGADVQAHSASAAASAAGPAAGLNAPLVLAKQGSFFVNQQNIPTAFATATGVPVSGSLSAKGMYVQYQIPAARNPRAYPVIMVHGSGHTGTTYEETPDGRMGWAEYFVRHGVPVYVVDHAGRARSGFDPTPINRAWFEGNSALVPLFGEFTNQQAWVNFRIGPAPFTPYETTQFPTEAQDQYFAQIVPNTESSYAEGGNSTSAALAALLDRVGPAVVLVHSQSGAYGIQAALARPELVKAVVSVEPRSCAVPDAEVERVFTRVKLLTMFGDFFGTSVADWPGRMAECADAVTRIRAAQGVAEHIHLPERGIHGNSHMLMLDRNNRQLADIILAWLDDNVRDR